jgi:hypothetical protein
MRTSPGIEPTSVALLRLVAVGLGLLSAVLNYAFVIRHFLQDQPFSGLPFADAVFALIVATSTLICVRLLLSGNLHVAWILLGLALASALFSAVAYREFVAPWEPLVELGASSYAAGPWVALLLAGIALTGWLMLLAAAAGIGGWSIERSRQVRSGQKHLE